MNHDVISLSHTCHCLLCAQSLTCVYSYVSDKLAGLFESLPAVVAAVGEAAAVDAFLVVSGTRAERPAGNRNNHRLTDNPR